MKLALQLCLVAGAAYLPLASADSTIVIVRHAEKPAQGLGQLSCKGLNRALALPSVLITKYGTPDVIYAPNPAIKKTDRGVPYPYIRPLATIEPLAIRAALPINIDWGMEDIPQLAAALLAQSNGTQVVAWEHHLAEKLAVTLMVTLGSNPQTVPAWEDTDFDSIYVLRISGQGKNRQVTFAHENEELNELSDECSN